MIQNSIGIDVITGYLSGIGLDVHPNGTQYVVTSTSDSVNLRFDGYKQLKAFYMGYLVATNAPQKY